MSLNSRQQRRVALIKSFRKTFLLHSRKCHKIVYHAESWTWTKMLFVSHVKSLSCSIQCTSGCWEGECGKSSAQWNVLTTVEHFYTSLWFTWKGHRWCHHTAASMEVGRKALIKNHIMIIYENLQVFTQESAENIPLKAHKWQCV